MHLRDCFAGLGHEVGDPPYSEKTPKESLAVPISPELSGAQLFGVAETIVRFFKKGA